MRPSERDLEVLHEWWGRVAPEVPAEAKGLWFPSELGTWPRCLLANRLISAPLKPEISAAGIRVVPVMSSSCVGGFDMETPAAAAV